MIAYIRIPVLSKSAQSLVTIHLSSGSIQIIADKITVFHHNKKERRLASCFSSILPADCFYKPGSSTMSIWILRNHWRQSRFLPKAALWSSRYQLLIALCCICPVLPFHKYPGMISAMTNCLLWTHVQLPKLPLLPPYPKKNSCGRISVIAAGTLQLLFLSCFHPLSASALLPHPGLSQ